MRTGLLVFCLISAGSLPGCAGLFLSKEERAAREKSLAALSKVGVLGASMSAGFGTGRTLADILDASFRSEHRLLDASDAEFFQNALERGEKAVGELKTGGATLVIGLDWLFWFAYGEKSLEQRRRDLAAGLKMLERFDCPVFLGDLPDMAGAAESILPARLVPPPGQLAELNLAIREWAEAHPGARLLPLSRWTESLRQGKPIPIGGREVVLEVGDILQGDRLHPTEEGQVLLASLCLEAVKEKLGGLLAGDLLLDRQKLQSRIDSQPCAVSIEVVDGEGVPVRDGTLRFNIVGFSFGSLSKLQLLRLARYAYLRDPQPIPDGGRFELSGIPSFAADFATYSVRAEAPWLTPSEEVQLRLLPGKTSRLRIALARPQRLELAVRDGATGEPLPAARAISVTEARIRGVDLTESLESGGPGVGSADAEGRLVLGDLRPGIHDVEVQAPGYETAQLEKVTVGVGQGTPVAASLRKSARPGSVSGVVRGPGGEPLAGVKVSLLREGLSAGRAVQSGPDGRIRFEGVPPGRYQVDGSIDLALWRKWKKEMAGNEFVQTRRLEVREGEESTVELGFILGTASLTVRVSEGERPLPGLRVPITVESSPDLNHWISGLKTGANGEVTYPRLRAGLYRARLGRELGSWSFEPWEVQEAESIERSLELGRARIRGRVLRGAQGAPGPVWVAGPGGRKAIAMAAADGSFEIPRAVPGRYRVEAPGAPPVEVEVPAEGDPPTVELRFNNESTTSMLRQGKPPDRQ